MPDDGLEGLDRQIKETREHLKALLARRAELTTGASKIDPSITLRELGLNVRVYNSLRRHGIRDEEHPYVFHPRFETVQSVVMALSDVNNFADVRNFGEGSVDHLLTRLRECGFISSAYERALRSNFGLSWRMKS